MASHSPTGGDDQNLDLSDERPKPASYRDYLRLDVSGRKLCLEIAGHRLSPAFSYTLVCATAGLLGGAAAFVSIRAQATAETTALVSAGTAVTVLALGLAWLIMNRER